MLNSIAAAHAEDEVQANWRKLHALRRELDELLHELREIAARLNQGRKPTAAAPIDRAS